MKDGFHPSFCMVLLKLISFEKQAMEEVKKMMEALGQVGFGLPLNGPKTPGKV